MKTAAGKGADEEDHAMMADGLILKSIEIAHGNWNKWRDVFEHGTPFCTSPLLTDRARFAAFCKEYSVGRTIRKGTQNDFRLALCEPPFSKALCDDSGGALDTIEEEMKKQFGTHNGSNRIVSVLSKVAAFVRPERFVAWDRYAKRGVNALRGRALSAGFKNYAAYLKEFDEIWIGRTGQQIRDHAMRTGARHCETEPRFLRRVLDVYLMKRGGRTWTS
jgi:hypothetical protein